MSSVRLLRSLLLALLATAEARPLLAQTVEAGAKGVEEPHRAVVVLVGRAAEVPELRTLLVDLLERKGVTCQVVSQRSLGNGEVLRDAQDDPAVRVFIVPGAQDDADLYFRGPGGDRFILRNTRPVRGFDELGRELVGQIVDTAVTLLSSPGVGLTREQAQLELGESAFAPPPARPRALQVVAAATTSASPASPEKAETEQRHVQKSRKPATHGTVQGWCALRYGVVQLGAPIGFVHGPGLELGLGVDRGWVLRGRLTGERSFARTLSTPTIGAELSLYRGVLAADLGVALGAGQLLLTSLGIGLERTQVKPERASGSTIVPAAAFEHDSPIARMDLRYELARGGFRVTGAIGFDTSLRSTHYDVARGAEKEDVLRPWLVRPQGSLALVFSPRLATY